MPLKFDNTLSWMDILAILGSAVTAALVVFGASERITLNEVEIAHLKSNVTRVERQASEANQQILQQLKEQGYEVKAIRTESASERSKIIEKLDRLIEREMSKEG